MLRPRTRRAAPALLAPALLAPALLVLSSCAAAPDVAAPAAPAYAPKGEAKCGVVKSQAEPLIVEWPSAARGKLETQARRGLVAVRYVGCDMQVLSRCRAPGAYQYLPMTRKRDRVTIRDEDELYANIPAYAASFEGKLKSAGELNVAMTLVGRYEADRGAVRRDELSGDCGEATHVITALTAGAFQFFAGAGAEAGAGVDVAGAGAGARRAAQRELLREDGDERACEAAGRDDAAPPDGCGALLRVEVVPLRDAAAGAPAAAEITCPAGSRREGGRCVGNSPACPPGAHFEEGKGCVPDPSGAAAQAAPRGVSRQGADAGELSQADIQRVVRAAMPQAKACVQRAQVRRPSLSGRVIVNMTIGAAGEVAALDSNGSSLPDAEAQRCVLKAFQVLTFPPPPQGSTKVTFPIDFAASAVEPMRSRD